MTGLNENICKKIHAADTRLKENDNYSSISIESNITMLFLWKSIEVGYRQQAGSTHPTHKMFREWIKIIKLLRKEGFNITETLIKHNNAYATNNGGFWNSSVFKLIEKDA